MLGSIFLWSWFTNNLRQPHTACNNSWWVRTYCGPALRDAEGRKTRAGGQWFPNQVSNIIKRANKPS